MVGYKESIGMGANALLDRISVAFSKDSEHEFPSSQKIRAFPGSTSLRNGDFDFVTAR
jgi:hypothetical protein